MKYIQTFLLSVFMLGLLMVEPAYSKEANLKEAHRLMFRTRRAESDLKKALEIYEKDYEKSGGKSDFSLISEYAYALYFKAAYTYPQEGKKNYDKFLPERLQIYKKADKILEPLVSDDSFAKTQEERAALYFIAGMIKGEIASINSSPFMIIKGRKLLEKSLSIDHTYRQGAVYLGLGRMYAKTPRILFGSQEKAISLLKHALQDFSPPNLVGFYFMMETLLDGEELDELSVSAKKQVLQYALQALSWEKKRKHFPPGSTKFITPEEQDSLKIIRQYLVRWHYPTSFNALYKKLSQNQP